MRPPEEVKKKIVRQWVEKAEEDLKSSEVLLAARPPLLYPSCFHAQQAAEKYLKALLTWHQIEFPKTHEIKELLILVAQVDQPLSSVLQSASALTPYGVGLRYPQDAPKPNLNQARRVVELARQVRDAVTRRIPADTE